MRMAKILLVDDEPEIRYIARRMLEKAGHEVSEACDGEECLQKLKAEKPDLILLDVMMPGLKGWEVCRRIKAEDRTRSIPVVMFTVRTSEEDLEESRKCGAEGHINKPFEREELLRVVNRVLDERSKLY
jgi:CheY-like chemotaxis protein